MKYGILPPLPKDHDFSKWCSHDALEPGDYWFMLGYLGSCPNCKYGQLKVPEKFMVEYLNDTEGGVHHVFRTIEEVRCRGCGAILQELAVLCMSKQEGINVTTEFVGEKK